MRRALQNHAKPVANLLQPFGRIRAAPAGFRLLLQHHGCNGNGLVKAFQQLALLNPRCRIKLQRPVPHISRSAHLRAKVIIQVARKMQHQITNAVPIRIRPGPDMLFCERLYQLMNRLRGPLEIAREILDEGCVK